MSKTIIIIPDSHAKPGVSNERYDWAAKLILDRRPDIVVDLGDFADMESLSSYDVGTGKFEGRRLTEDIAAASDARARLTKPIIDVQTSQVRNKKKVWRPELIALIGNHEQRISRLMNNKPELAGMFPVDVSGAGAWGWKVYPFLEIVEREGIAFSHYFTSGIMGRPVGGVNPASALIAKLHQSCVQGHMHILDYKHMRLGNGRTLNGLIAGCFFEHYEDYAGPANQMWTRGIAVLNNVANGDYDLEWISMDELKRRYA